MNHHQSINVGFLKKCVMGVSHLGHLVNNYGIVLGSGAMFTELVRIGFSFPACLGGSAKYQTCLIFHQTSPTLDTNLGSAHLVSVVECH